MEGGIRERSEEETSRKEVIPLIQSSGSPPPVCRIGLQVEELSNQRSEFM